MNEKFATRKTIRLKDYDYSNNGYYFVTICTKDRKKILSNIVGNDALVVPTKIGEEVIKIWNNIEKNNNGVYIDSFVLMPNHIHGIIIIDNDNKYKFDKHNETERRGRRSLQCLIKDFKSVTTRIYNKMSDKEEKNRLWQKSYYEHVIRNPKELYEIQKYIEQNPISDKEDY